MGFRYDLGLNVRLNSFEGEKTKTKYLDTLHKIIIICNRRKAVQPTLRKFLRIYGSAAHKINFKYLAWGKKLVY